MIYDSFGGPTGSLGRLAGLHDSPLEGKTMDPLTIGMLVILAVLVFFMFRNSRKRKADLEQLRTKIVPGAEVMTNFGLYGTLVSLDDVTKVAELEVSPGSIVRVHSQTIAKVVDDGVEGGEPGAPRSVEEAMAIANREAEERERAALGNDTLGKDALSNDTPSSDALGNDVPSKAVSSKDAAILLDDPAYGERIPEADKPDRRTTKKAAE